MRIDGKEVAQKILEELKIQVLKLSKKDIIPYLVIILVGNDPASQAYVRQKELKGNLIGVKTTIIRMPSNVKTTELFSTIEQLNNDDDVTGIIVQQPLPSHINEKEIVLKVNPKKDIDGLHPKSPYPMPLAAAVLKILEETFRVSKGLNPSKGSTPNFIHWLKSKSIVVIGKGETGGRPTIKLLKDLEIEPEIIDSKTKNPQKLTKNADIIISAVGKQNVLKINMLKKGVILIGVGLYRGKDNKLHTDYNLEEIQDIASFYTPVPGGVGPVNVAMLLKNLTEAASFKD